MGFLDDITAEIKKDPEKHYRLTHADTAKVTRRKVQGFENVPADSPELKGTALAKGAQADGTVRVGDLILQRVSRQRADELKKQVEAKTQARLDSIKRRYLDDGERIKRSLGKQHSGIKLIHEEKDE
jgi:hypothetical protein